MICSLYNDRLERIAILGTLRSLVWCESYAEAGVSQMVVVKNDEYAAKIKTGYFIGLDNSDTLQVITQVTDKGGQLWVYMRECKWILSDRIYDGTFRCGVVESSLKAAVKNKRPYDIVTAKASSRLPEGYTELEYIESSGTQYIDTGVIPAYGYTAECGFIATNIPSGTSESWVYAVFDITVSGYPRMRSGLVGSSYYTDASNGAVYTGNAGEYTVSKGGVSAANCSLSVYVFSAHEKTGAVHTANSMYRLYYLNFYDASGNLINEFVPCTDPNGEAGLYDTMTDTFHGNLGTGSIIAGTKIPEEETAVLTAEIGTERTYNSLYDISCAVCGAVGYGFKLRHERAEKMLYYEVYNGADRTDVKFSEKFGNMRNAVITLSDLDWKNVAYVGGAGEGSERIFVTVGETGTTGFDRREMYVDARDIQPIEGESEAAYQAKLEARGLEKLAERRRVEGIEFEINPAGYGGRFTLGDKVTAVIPERGMIITVRITGIKRKYENNMESLSMILGDPVIRRNY